MEQVPVDKYNIAWFRLAEYISRGEKERALGMYRLLAHSFNDLAFSQQLEGDILWSFNDTSATEKYQSAAHLYMQDNRLLQAAAVYETLYQLEPTTGAFLEKLINLYAQLDNKQKLNTYVYQRAHLLVNAGLKDQAQEFQACMASLVPDARALLCEYYVVCALQRELPVQVMQEIIERVAKEYVGTLTLENWAQFLEKLKIHGEQYYDFALSIAENYK